MRTVMERYRIAEEIIRRADMVSLLTMKECDDIHRRAELGEFDDIFDDEKALPDARKK